MRELTVARKCVGIDIGSHSVKAVVASKKGSLVVIRSFAEIPISRSGPAEPEQVGAAMEELCGRLKIGSALVVTCISTQRTTVRNLEIPFREEEKVRQVLKSQTEPYLAYPIEEVIIDFYNTQSAPEGRMKVLLTAIHKDVIKERVELLSRSEIDPEVVDVDFMAVCNTALQAEPRLREGGVTVLDVGASKTIACYIQDGKLLAVRSIALGGDDFTTAISEELGVGFEEAERIKLEMAEPAVTKAIASVLERFGGELGRTVRYFASQVRAGTFDRVILSGGTASLPGLDKFLGEALSGELSVVSASETIKNISGEEMPFPRFATAVGLALRGLGECLCLQNFRQEEHAYSRPLRRLRKNLVVSGALVFLTAALLVFSLFASLDRYRGRQVDLDFRIQTKQRTIFPDKATSDIARMRELLKEEASKLTPFRELRRNILILEVLDDLSARIPKEIQTEVSLFSYIKSKLPQLSGTRRRRRTQSKTKTWAGAITFKGTVSSDPEVVELERILKELPYFGEVVNKGTSKRGGCIA